MYKINQVADLTGLSIHTLRYYEDMGLIFPMRDQANYRVYTEYEVEKLLCISKLREIGLSLPEIKSYEMANNTEDEIVSKVQVLRNYLNELLRTKQDIENNIKRLKHRIELFEKEGK